MKQVDLFDQPEIERKKPPVFPGLVICPNCKNPSERCTCPKRRQSGTLVSITHTPAELAEFNRDYAARMAPSNELWEKGDYA